MEETIQYILSCNVQKECPTCGEYFTPKNNQQHFCSRRCRPKHGPPKLGKMIPCSCCGKEVYRRPYQIKRTSHTFCSRICEGKFRSPVYKEKYPHGFSGVDWHHSEKTKAKLKKTMNSPEVIERIASKLRGELNPFYGRHHTPESIQRGNVKRRAWLDIPENRRKTLEGAYKGWLILTKQLQRYLKDGLPNPSERQLLEILEECCPGEYKYNDGWFQLGGKLPDFVNVNGEKKIIELFGELYHKPDEVGKKQEFYRQFGWRTLIIWAKELKDSQKVKERICSFTKGGDKYGEDYCYSFP